LLPLFLSLIDIWLLELQGTFSDETNQKEMAFARIGFLASEDVQNTFILILQFN